MDRVTNCIKHPKKLNEIYCLTCKSYLCPECITNHEDDGHTGNYTHILHYAPKRAIPMVDQILKDISATDSDVNYEATEFVASVQTVVQPLQEVINMHAECANRLRLMSKQLEGFAMPTQPLPFIDRMRNGITSDKKRLEQALASKNIKDAIAMTQRIEAESSVSLRAANKNDSEEMIENVLKALEPLKDKQLYGPIMETTQKILNKCQHFRLAPNYGGGWKCDRKYLSHKMTLSENGLVVGNSASNGYPAIIGDTPFDCGMYSFDVVP